MGKATKELKMKKVIAPLSILMCSLKPAFGIDCLGNLIASPKVNKEHFVEVSPYANPIEAFISYSLFEEEKLIESKYLAGMRVKIQDHHTNSGLYSDIRSSLIDRGLYNSIKSNKEVRDQNMASFFAKDLLNDFYEQLAKSSRLTSFLSNAEKDEEFLGAYSLLKSEYQLIMNINDCPMEKVSGEVVYYGHIRNNDIQSVVVADHHDTFSFHKINDGQEGFVAALKNPKGTSICNKDFSFYACGDSSHAPVAPGSLVAVLAAEGTTIPQSIFDTFSIQEYDKSFLKFVTDAMDELEDQDMPVYIDFPFVKVTNGVAPHALIDNNPKYDNVNKVISKDASYFPTKVIQIEYSPSSKSDWDAEFRFKGEKRVLPGESVYLVLPEGFSDRPLANVILGHRQNPKDQRGYASFNNGHKVYDQYPAYTSVQVHSVELPYKDSWRTWGGPVSSDKGSKFAEIKKGPEFDNLYEWPLKGHKSLRTGKELKQPLRSDLIKIEVLGDDPVYLDSVVVKVVPPKSNNYVDLSFTRSKTFMGDPETFKGRKFGGGQRYGGKFPGAKRLSPHRGRPDSLVINLNGESIQSVNVAAGDTKPDGVRNRDGGTGSLGHARVSIIIERVDGKRITLVDQENVAPQGVISGHASGNGIKAKSIIIEAHSDTAYIMGIQYGFN